MCVLRVLMKSLMTRGFRPVTTVTEGNGGGNGVEIRRLYLPTVESYGRGARFDFFLV